MATPSLQEKLEILADAAKYDASCASSGTAKRSSKSGKGLGSTEGMGICHSYAPDGRCISLLKILLTNHCIFDCHYCINRKSSDVRRARFTIDEVVDLTLSFYRRNYIEGLFLSSGIIKSSSHTMEQMVEVARKLREEHDFRGYIHLKTIPDADPLLIKAAGLHADRLSINVELPTVAGLQRLAPDKDGTRIEGAMDGVKASIIDNRDARRKYRSAPRFAPAGQSTQMIVGADGASDCDIVGRAQDLYQGFGLKRVYYSAFSPIPDASAVLPLKSPPLIREHRLYQSDWLIRFYGFSSSEVQQAADPSGMLPLDIDPKMAWALRFRESFPVDVNRAPREALLRVPGLGVRAVDAVVRARRQKTLRLEDVGRLTVSVNRIKPFIVTADWRPVLLAGGIDPAEVSWEGASLFGDPLPASTEQPQRKVSAAYLKLAETVFMHRDPARLALLYRLLWRTGIRPRLLDDASDPDVGRASQLAHAVRRDIHKMRAFVRFREVRAEGEEPWFVAWHEPDHRILRANAKFFTNRFTNMRWSILTPDLSLHWDGAELTEAPGATRADAPGGDAEEELWRSYYAAIFNPARLKIAMMTKEMPRRYWRNMPETALIPGLIASAQARSAAMIARGAGPGEAPPADWAELRAGIDRCTRCSLHCQATQPIHGEGPQQAALAIVGEQPGDQEDLAGRAFVGPAGQLLDGMLAQAGVDRSQAYVTNAVKHFKFTQRGKQRIHATPTAGEIDHCRWWLDAEIGLVKPRVIVALGASAARGILGRTINVSATRGVPQILPSGAKLLVTTHPAYLLRLGDAAKPEAEANFRADLRMAGELAALT